MDTFEAEIFAFALDAYGPKTMQSIGLKMAEEAGEVAGAIIKIPENRATVFDLDREVGDLLIVLSQLAAIRGTTLDQLRLNRWMEIKARRQGCLPQERRDS